MNKKFCILTDSSCSKELLQNVGGHIQILPLSISDGEDQEYVDDFEPDKFIELLKSHKSFKTSATPMGKMFEYFENLSAQYDLVIYLSISSHLSSQFSQAQITVKELDLSERFWVFDSQNAAVGLSHAVLIVNQLLTTNPDATYQEVAEIIKATTAKCYSWFTCNEVKRLIKSGRGGKKLLTYLNKLIRPIIGFDGKNQLLSVSATLNGAINKMVKLVVKELAHQKDAIQSLVLMKCSETNEQIEVMKAKLVSALEIAPEQIQILSAPSVIACHTGLETFGIGVQLK